MASIACLLKASPKGQLKYESDPNIEKVILKFKHKPKIQLVGTIGTNRQMVYKISRMVFLSFIVSRSI